MNDFSAKEPKTDMTAINRNLRYASKLHDAASEKRLAFLGELAESVAKEIQQATGTSELLSEILSFDEAERIYRTTLAGVEATSFFDGINGAEAPLASRMLTRFDRLYLCRRLSLMGETMPLSALIPKVCGAVSPIPTEKDRKVAFLRNRQASRAFERFAKHLGGVSAAYEDNFRDACEAVFTGRSTYAIIPIHSTADGRLNGFYRQMEKYDLSIVLIADVDSDDGENATTFALVYRERLYIHTGGMPLYECKITFSTLTELSDLADAASYFHATLESVEALPMAFSGRANTFEMVFGLKNADICGLFTYLALEYPQTVAVGIYDRME